MIDQRRLSSSELSGIGPEVVGRRPVVRPSTGRSSVALLLGALAVAVVVAACRSSPTTAAPSAQVGGSAAIPPLAAGAHQSTAFKPAVTYTVPTGWDNPVDSADYFEVRPAGSDQTGIHVFRDPVAASQDAACPATAEPGVGATSAALVAWFRTRPGLVVSDPTPTAIGGLVGVYVDLAIADGWKTSCSFANGLPTVPLIVGTASSFRWIIVGNERLRMYLLDLPAASGGGLVIVDIDAFDGTLIDGLLSAAAPVVQSLHFAAN
jgi:hypothetical protein